MKAILVEHYGGPEVLRLKEVPDPRASAGELLVRLKAAGVNPVETYQRAGAQGYGPKLPFTPGIDGAGVVEAAGPGARKFKPGDRIYLGGSLGGTYAEKCVCREEQAHALPDSLSFEQGACLYVNYSTAYRALFQRGGAAAGETVLVHGATGGVGVAALQWARLRGLSVFGTYGSPEGEALLAEQGAAGSFSHKDAGRFKAMLEASGGRGFDLIVELLANVNLAEDLGLLAKGGRVVVVGSRGEIAINPRMLMSRDADLRGMTLFNTPERDFAEIHAAAAAALNSGALKPVVQEAVPLAEAARAHAAVLERASRGKIVLSM